MSAYVAYSANEKHRVSAVVLIVLAFATNFEFDNLFKRLLREAILHILLIGVIYVCAV